MEDGWSAACVLQPLRRGLKWVLLAVFLQGRCRSPAPLTVGARVANGATGAAHLSPQQLVLRSGQQPYDPGSAAGVL